MPNLTSYLIAALSVGDVVFFKFITYFSVAKNSVYRGLDYWFANNSQLFSCHVHEFFLGISQWYASTNIRKIALINSLRWNTIFKYAGMNASGEIV